MSRLNKWHHQSGSSSLYRVNLATIWVFQFKRLWCIHANGSQSTHSPEINNPEHTAHFRAVVGSLLYLANWTRPDICFAVGELSKVLANPGPVHLRAAHRLLRYLKRTSNLGITYSAHRNSAAELNQLWGYCDADWGGDPDSFKSTGGYVCFLNGGAISWKSKRQQSIALSSAEAEFMAASRMAQEVVYLRHLLSQFGYVQELPTVVYEDNKAAISMSENAGLRKRTLFINLQVHFFREKVQNGDLVLTECKSEHNVAGILAKGLRKAIFQFLRGLMMSI